MMNTYRVRNEAGETFEVDEDRISEAEADGFLPVVSNGRDSYRVSLPDLPKARSDGFRPWNEMAAEGEAEATRMADLKDQYDKPLGVAVRSVSRGLSAGFSDEIGGGLGAVAEKLSGSEKSFADAYTENRDEQRRKYRMDDINHPTASLAGRIAGGVGTGLIAPGANTLSGSAVYGGAQGLGESEDRGLGLVKDTALGAGAGLIGYGVGKGIEKVPSAYRAVKGAVKPGMEAAREVSRAGVDAAKDVPALAPITAPIAAVKKVLEMGRDKVGEKRLADAFRKHIGPGHMEDMTDRQVIAQMVLEKNDQAIAYVANRANALTGADAEAFTALLKAGPDARISARDFDFDEAGGDLIGSVRGLSDELDRATGIRRGQLEESARQNFKADLKPVLTALQQQHHNSGQLGSTKGAQSVLSDVYEIIRNGRNADDLGLKSGNWTEQSGREHFNRLAAARTELDRNIDWLAIKEGKRSPKPVEVKLMQVRAQIDDALKGASDSKVESDALWQDYEKLKTGLLGSVKKGGEINKYKVGDTLRDRRSAKEFRDNLELLDRFLAKEGLTPEVKAAAEQFKEKYAGLLEKAELKRFLDQFERSVVGSSKSGRAAQAAESLKRGDNILTEMTKAPEQSMRSSEGMIKTAEKYFGKPFKKMSPSEIKLIVRFSDAIKENPNLDFVQTVEAWRKAGGR